MGVKGGRKMGVDTQTYTCDETVVKHTHTIYSPCHKRIEIQMKQLITFFSKTPYNRKVPLEKLERRKVKRGRGCRKEKVRGRKEMRMVMFYTLSE